MPSNHLEKTQNHVEGGKAVAKVQPPAPLLEGMDPFVSGGHRFPGDCAPEGRLQ